VNSARQSSLREYVQILRRRKWIVLAVVLVVAAAATALSLQQSASYRATAQVLLNRQDLSAAISGTQDTGSSQDPGRYAFTQAGLARVPAVVRAAIAKAHVDVSLKSLLANSTVKSAADSDLLDFEVDHGTRAGAQRLVNEYARAYVAYRRRLDTQALDRAQADVETRLRTLERTGDTTSPLHRSLAAKADELRTLRAVQTPHAILVRRADGATQTRPKPVRTGLLALVLGLGLGVALAFLVHALDTRVGSAVEIAESLRLPLLARLPRPPKQLARENRLVMLDAPESPASEAFRVLRTNLELVNLDRDARTILVASAAPGEGKSTTIANLAVAAARAGRQVVLVDLDLRRGDVDKLFAIGDEPGISDVAVGTLTVGEALVPIEISPDTSAAAAGSLHVLPAGHLPPSAGEVAASGRVGEIIAELSDHADLVLIDAPPFLHVGDAMALSARAEGLVVVARLGLRRPMIDEIRRALEKFRADPLGLVVTGDETDRAQYTSYGVMAGRQREVHDPVA
jgi:capsular exopolysaccharide synthesis family protein